MPWTIDGSTGPRRRALFAAWLLAALCALAGCGGSGSSGFDTIASENDAIDRALNTSGCEVERGLTICASGAEAPPASPSPTAPALPSATPSAITNATGTPTPSTTPGGAFTATPTRTATQPPSQPGVDVILDPSDINGCVGSADSQSCTIGVLFIPVSAPVDAVYRGAFRQRDPDGQWRIVPVTGNRFEVDVPPDVSVVQTAVLLYERDPGPVPTQVPVLSDSGADFAFVTAPFTVREAGAP